MSTVLAVIALHVGAGVLWASASLAIAAVGRMRRWWLQALLGVALVNVLAGIWLWHALHAGPWGSVEHLLVAGTFCAFLALGLQAPVALIAPGDARRLAGPSLAIFRASALVLLAAAAAMVGSRYG